MKDKIILWNPTEGEGSGAFDDYQMYWEREFTPLLTDEEIEYLVNLNKDNHGTEISLDTAYSVVIPD